MKARFPWAPAEHPDLAPMEHWATATANGRVLYVVGLKVTIYIERGDRPEVRHGIVSAFKRFRQVGGRPFTWAADPESGEARRVQGVLEDPTQWPSAIFNRFDFQMVFHGGEDVDDADAYSFVAVSREREEGQLSYVSASLPLDWADTHSPDEYVEWVAKLCELTGPTHGYAGLAVNCHPMGADDEAAGAMFRLAARYPGLEIDIPQHHEPFLASEHRIKGVNWLTILGDSWMERLGGRQALVQRLGQAVQVRSYCEHGPLPGGLIIRAGWAPSLSSSRQMESIDIYKHVAQVLRPIRTLNPAVVWPQGAGGVSYEDAAAWMRRFD